MRQDCFVDVGDGGGANVVPQGDSQQVRSICTCEVKIAWNRELSQDGYFYLLLNPLFMAGGE